MLTEAKLAEIRDLYFEPKAEWATSRIDRVLGAAQLRKGERVLDLGSSQGTFSFHALRLGAEPFGIDRNPVILGLGREAARRIAGIELPLICADALALPFPDKTFDVVINADFIEHTPDEDKKRIFEESFRVLKPAGRGLVYSPNLARIEWELAGEKIKYALGLRREKVPRWQDFVDPDHFGLTTPGKTCRLLQAVGFETRLEYFEHHIPVISKLPLIRWLCTGAFPAQFAARFLIHLTKPATNRTEVQNF